MSATAVPSVEAHDASGGAPSGAPGGAPGGPAKGAPSGAPPTGRGEAALLVGGSILLAVAVIGTRWGVFTPDTRPDLYQAPGSFLRSTVQAWVGGASGLGQGNFNAGAAPVAAVLWVIRTLGAPAWLAVRIWRLALLLLGAWGVRRYLGALLGPRLTVQARVLVTVFWVVNPYAIVSGSTTPILLPYALLPWTMLALLHALRSPRSWRWPALFGVAFFLQTGLNAGVVPFFQLLAIPGHLAHARWIEGRSWRELVRVVVRCGAAAFAVSLYWLLPSVLAAGTGAGIASGTENPEDVARTSSYAETARLLGNWPLYGRAGDREFLGGYTVYLTSPVVVLATFLVPLAMGVALWRSRARERLLVAGLLLASLPIMVGLFPPDDPSPLGRLMAATFERVPASLAFRTTNKVGSVVVLATAIALALGWRAWQARTRTAPRGPRLAAVGLVGLLLVAISAPMWNGDLYPLGYTIPRTWEQATDDLDEVRPDHRVLALPGGTGGNYRWGMRSPDDLFPSLLDRPVAVRNTVVARGEPAANLLSTFDTQLALGGIPDGSIATMARLLGAGDVLVRNDLLIEEIGGPAPASVVRQVARDDALVETARYGEPGTDTVPGSSGPATRADRIDDPANAAQPPLITYEVVDPTDIVRAAPARSQVLVAGDGDAIPALAGLGLIDGTEPLQLLGDLDDEAFARAVADGGRVVLTDTNRRRAWDVNRTSNATSATLSVADDIDAGDGATVTRWPDAPRHQTVSELEGAARVSADRPGFGLHPFGRPSNAFDGDPSTAWLTGGFQSARGTSLRIELSQPKRISGLTITSAASQPSSATAVRVQVDDKQVVESLPVPGTPVEVRIEPSVADRVEITLLAQSPGPNPVGLAEVEIDGVQVTDVARLPRSLQLLASRADASTLERLASLPLDVVLTRARGSVIDPTDDEEFQLHRRFELPQARTFELRATLGAADTDDEAVEEALAGEATCRTVATLDGEPVEARIVSDAEEILAGQLELEGCEPLELAAGVHDLRTIFGWRLDQVHLSSPGTEPVVPVGDGEDAVEVVERSATELVLEVPASEAGDRYLRIGEGFDERWQLELDGRDAGPPIVVDGYSTGWRIDGEAHSAVVRFGPQRAVEGTFVASAVALVAVTAIALLPTPPRLQRRRT